MKQWKLLHFFGGSIRGVTTLEATFQFQSSYTRAYSMMWPSPPRYGHQAVVLRGKVVVHVSQNQWGGL